MLPTKRERDQARAQLAAETGAGAAATTRDACLGKLPSPVAAESAEDLQLLRRRPLDCQLLRRPRSANNVPDPPHAR